MRSAVHLLLATAVAANPAYIRNTRRAIPQELFRDNVEPATGGKVPEAAHMRVELNKLDAAGLETGEGVQMMQQLQNSDIVLPEKADSQYNPGKKSFADSFFPESAFSANFPFDSVKISSLNDNSYGAYGNDFTDPFFNNYVDNDYDYNPGYSPPLKLKPDYKPVPESYPSSPSYTPAPYSPPSPAYESAYTPDPSPYAPSDYGLHDAYVPETYAPAPVQPEYAPPEPAYAPPKPVGPVLLEKRPYEVKSVQPLPISVSETYTNFDCRKVAYLDRHYADPEAGCQIYHFCHADGKQDTFHCGYGTIFNEYLGTCDYKNNVHCEASGQGAPLHHVAAAPLHHAAAPVHLAPATNAGHLSSFHDSTPFHSFGSFGK